MGALLINPEIPISFWSFRKSREAVGAKALVPPLGLLTAAALLPQEWEFRVADLQTRSLTEDDWAWADMVLVTAMLVQKPSFLSVIREAKRRQKTVVVGGPYPTSVPEASLEAGADFLVRGEGENTIPRFLAALNQGSPGGVIENDQKPDISQSPIPRYDLVHPDHYSTVGIQTSRGCPFDCEFCDVVHLYGHRPRYKHPDQVIGELETLYDLGWRRELFVADDNFIGNIPHAKAILEKLIPWMEEKGKPFSIWTQTSLNLGRHVEMIDLMTQANFSTVVIGVESPDEELLALNRKYQNIRNPLEESINTIRDHGLTVVASFVLGFDQEKRGAGERICSFVERTAVPMPAINLLHIYPNTSLWNRMIDEGRLREQWTDLVEPKLNFVPTRPESEIIDEYVQALEYLYEPSRFLWRAYRYYSKMRPTRRALARKQGKSLPTETSRSRPPFKYQLREIWAFLQLLWQYGITGDCRIQFWSQFFDLLRTNPTRVRRYLAACFNGQSILEFRDQLKRAARKRNRDMRETPCPAASFSPK